MGPLLYKRVLLKLSGESFVGEQAIDAQMLQSLSQALAEVIRLDVELAIVLGAGNLFRGGKRIQQNLNPLVGDQIGMLGTVMNGLALADSLEQLGIATAVLSAFPVHSWVEVFERRRAQHYLNQKCVLILVGGTGNPLVSTDSAASLRAIEIGAEILLKATQVDGIYAQDPASNASARLYKSLNYQEAIDKRLGVMDLNAFLQCRDHRLPIRVFNLNLPGVLKRILMGAEEGTLVSDKESSYD